jgi:hypothetical protein
VSHGPERPSALHVVADCYEDYRAVRERRIDLEGAQDFPPVDRRQNDVKND